MRTQWRVGAYRIDLVVEGTEKRLAVECDGERWHTRENFQQDTERQAVLQRLGWVFVRIRGSLFFRDRDAAMEPVFAKLHLLGIEPHGVSAQEEGESPAVERTRREAEAVRRQWLEE